MRPHCLNFIHTRFPLHDASIVIDMVKLREVKFEEDEQELFDLMLNHECKLNHTVLMRIFYANTKYEYIVNVCGLNKSIQII